MGALRRTLWRFGAECGASDSMAGVTTDRSSRMPPGCLSGDETYRIGDGWTLPGLKSRSLQRSSPLTLTELDQTYQDLDISKRSPLRFRDSSLRDSDCFDCLDQYPSVNGLRSRSGSSLQEERTRSARWLYYEAFGNNSCDLTNEDFRNYDQNVARRRQSLSRPAGCCRRDDTLHSAPHSMGLRHFDVDPEVSLSENGKKKVQLMDCLRDAHGLLEGQSDQLRKQKNQLEESKSKIELLSWNQKRLENSISQLEEEKDLFQVSHCEDQRNQAELQEKILHLEKEMAKTKCSLEQIYQGWPSVLLYPTHTFPLTEIGEDLLKQGKATLVRELQAAQDTVRVYQDWAMGVEEERDKVFEELKTFREAQHSALLKTNESNQRLTDSLRAQSSLHDELSDLRINCSEASLERDLLSSKVLRLDGAVEDLKAKLVAAVAEKDRFFKEKIDLHQRVQLLSLELERAQRGKESFDEQVASLYVELVSSKSQANRQDQEKVLLKEELATIEQVNKRVSSDLAEIQRKLVSCQEELHQLEAEKKILNNRMEALEAERSQLISEKEMLVTAATISNENQDNQLLTFKADCEALRVSQVELNKQNKGLEAALQQKAEELAAVTLEQQQVALHWKEKWQEAALALKAKDKEVHQPPMTCEGSNAKQESLSLVRVELDACKQELALEKSRGCKLQRRVQALQNINQRPSQTDQVTMFHKCSGSAVRQTELRDQEAGCDRDVDGGDLVSQEGHLFLQLESKDAALSRHLLKCDTSSLSSLCSLPAPPLVQELLSQITVLQEDLRDVKAQHRQQQEISKALREELEEAYLNEPGEFKTSLEEVDNDLFQVREELEKVWDMLHVRNSELEEQHQELESARDQRVKSSLKTTENEPMNRYTECNSEKQRLVELVTSLQQDILEKEQELRRLERLRQTEKIELEIKISSLELRLAEVDLLGENTRPREEVEKLQSCPPQGRSHSDDFVKETNAEAQDHVARNTEFQEVREEALKLLDELQDPNKMTSVTHELLQNESLVKENLRLQQQQQQQQQQHREDIGGIGFLREEAFVVTSDTESVPALSKRPPSNPGRMPSFPEFKPFNRRGNDPSPTRGDNINTSPRLRDQQRCIGLHTQTLPNRGTVDTGSIHQSEVCYNITSTSQLPPKEGSLTEIRTPSPFRQSSPDPAVTPRSSTPDLLSPASGTPSEEEKPQTRAIPSAIKCSLLLSPRPFHLHRSNLTKKIASPPSVSMENQTL